MFKNYPDMLSPRECMEALGIGKNTMYRLLNTGEELPFAIELLPNFFDLETGKADGEYLHITNIPIDELENEPIVVEVEW